MLIKCCFVIIVMVDTIYSASSQSSLKFPPAFGIIHHVLLQHLDFYLDHPTFFPAQVRGGGYMKISSRPPFVHIYISMCMCMCVYVCVCVCVHLFLVD
jgi:hypothetical protein